MRDLVHGRHDPTRHASRAGACLGRRALAFHRSGRQSVRAALYCRGAMPTIAESTLASWTKPAYDNEDQKREYTERTICRAERLKPASSGVLTAARSVRRRRPSGGRSAGKPLAGAQLVQGADFSDLERPEGSGVPQAPPSERRGGHGPAQEHVGVARESCSSRQTGPSTSGSVPTQKRGSASPAG